MTPTKVQGIWNSRYASQIIRSKMAKPFYEDRGFFHEIMVVPVDSMRSYFEELEIIVRNPVVQRENPWYAFRARRERQRAQENASNLLQAFTESELLEFSCEALKIAHTDERIYQRAVNHLFDTYKVGPGPQGEWKPVPQDDPQLDIIQSIDRLVKRYYQFQQRFRPEIEGV